MAPEIFQPGLDGAVKLEGFTQSLPAAEPAAEDSAQEVATEAPAGQEPAAPEPQGAPAPDRARVGQQIIAEPPGEAPALTPPQDTPADTADAATGVAPAETGQGLPYDVLVAAGAAGLSADHVKALGTAEAIRAAIEIKTGGKAATTAPAATEGTETAEAPALPELKPWEFKVPEELRDAEAYDPKVVKFLDEMAAYSKSRDDAYRAHIAALSNRTQTGNGDAQRYSEMMFDMTLNGKLGEETYKPYADKLGVGWQVELSGEQFENRQRVAETAGQLYERQRAQGKTPKLADVIMQAAGIVFPEIASKLGQKAIASRIAARPKVGRPGGGVADTRDPRQRAIDDIAEAQRAAGIR